MSVTKKDRILKSVRNITISFAVLLLILIVGGVAYVWFIGQNEEDTSNSAIVQQQTSVVVKKPAQPAANSKIGVSIQSLTTPVTPGSNTSVTIRTKPGAKCSISAIYNNVASKDSGLINKVADDYGMVDWTWTIESATPLGKWPVNITCVDNKQSAFVRGDLVVERSAN